MQGWPPTSRHAASGSLPFLDRRLTLAVIAEAARLEHRRPADPLDRRRKLGRRSHIGERRGADAEPGDKVLFGEPVLRGRQDFRIGQDRNARRQKRRGLRRHVLELIGNDIDIRGEAVERLGVGVIGAGDAMHDVEGGRIRIGREDVALEAEPRRGQRQHAAELAAAEDADGGLGFECGSAFAHAPSFGASATAAVCRARHASSRLLSAGSLSASTLAARQRGIDRAGLTDRQRADRHARRHLHDGVKRILSRQRLGFDRHAENRKAGERGGHARQMRRAAGTGDDHLKAFRLRALGEGIEPFRSAVGGDDAGLVADVERVERLGGMFHGLPVGLAAHDNGH